MRFLFHIRHRVLILIALAFIQSSTLSVWASDEPGRCAKVVRSFIAALKPAKVNLDEKAMIERSLSEWGDRILTDFSGTFNKMKEAQLFSKATDFHFTKGVSLSELDNAKSWEEFIGIAAGFSENASRRANYKSIEAVQDRLRQALNAASGYGKPRMDLPKDGNKAYHLRDRLVDLLTMNAINGTATRETFGYLNHLAQDSKQYLVHSQYMRSLERRLEQRINDARGLRKLKISPSEFLKFDTYWTSSHYHFMALRATNAQYMRPFREKMSERARDKIALETGEAIEEQLAAGSTYQALEMLADLEEASVPEDIAREADLRSLGKWARELVDKFKDSDGGGGKRIETPDVLNKSARIPIIAPVPAGR